MIETLRGAIRLRPTRIAFLVSPFDHASVRRIMRYCTCLWGGRYNPIIPVSSRLPVSWTGDHFQRPRGVQLAHRYIRFFEPDVFVDATKGFAKRLGYSDDKVAFHHPRVVPIDKFISEEDFPRREFLYGLNVFDVYRHLHDKEYKFVRRHDDKFSLFDIDDAQSAFFEAVYGSFPPEDELGYIKQGYIDTFEPTRLEPTYSSIENVLLNKLSSPLRVTSYGLDIDVEGMQEPLAFVFDPNEACDLIDFWNLRTTRRDILPVNVHWFSDMSDRLKEFIKRNYRPLPGNNYGVMIHPTIEFASSIGNEYAEELRQKHLSGLDPGSFGVKSWYTSLWDDSREDRIMRPARAGLTAESKDVELLIQGEERSAWIETLSPKFADRFGQEVRWVNVLTVGAVHSEGDLALCFPLKRQLKDFPKLRPLRNVLVSREGVVLFQKHIRSRDLIEWSTGRDAIIGWLESQNVTARPSDAGRTTEQLIRSVGNLRGVELFADEATIRKLDEMAARRQVRSAEGSIETREYPDRTAPVAEWIGLLQKRANHEQRFHSFTPSDFTDKNILRLGIEVQCTVCHKNNWYSIDEIDLLLTCSRCLGTFKFPQGDLKFKSTPWHYRVVGPFSVPDYAAGGYATALTLRLIAHGLGTFDAQITYATGLDLKLEERSIEVDFVLWHQRGRYQKENQEPATLFGEAKSYAKEAFTEGELEKLRALAMRFPGSFLVLSCLKSHISAKEKRIIKGLAEWGRAPLDDGSPRAPVIVLTGNELFYEWHLEETWKKAGGKPNKCLEGRWNNLRDLWRLADITQQVYLDLPTWHEWVHKWYKAKWERKKTRATGSVGNA